MILFLDDSTAWIDIPLYCNDSHQYKFKYKKKTIKLQNIGRSEY